MKTPFISCLTSIFLLISCEETAFIQSSSLTGNWQLVGSYYGIGGPQIYKEADKKTKSYISFGKDGELQDGNSGYTSYRLKDSATVTFVKKDGAKFDYF